MLQHSIRFTLILTSLMGMSVLMASSPPEPVRPPPETKAERPLTPEEQVRAFARAQLAEKVRAECIEGRRYVAGRVLDVTTNGLVIDSGYSVLLQPPFNQSWVVPGNATVARDSAALEQRHPDAVCIGEVFLSHFPRKPKVKPYDYVVIHAYPAGEEIYRPLPGVEKKLRHYSASLESAVQLEIKHRER